MCDGWPSLAGYTSPKPISDGTIPFPTLGNWSPINLIGRTAVNSDRTLALFLREPSLIRDSLQTSIKGQRFCTNLFLYSSLAIYHVEI